MSESYQQTAPNRARSWRSRAGLAMAALALAACSHVTQNSARTASPKIRHCPDSLALPGSSDGTRLSRPYSRLTARADSEARTVFDRVGANGGNIVLNQNLDTSASIKGHALRLKIENSAALAPGYEVDIAFESGDPAIGLGSLACNGTDGSLFETKTVHAIDYFYAQTGNFVTTTSS